MTTTTRARKPKTLPGLPAPGTHYVTCAAPACGRQYPPAEDCPPVELYPGAGDFDSVRWHARGEGWTHDEAIGDICPADEFYPWKPLRLAITAGDTDMPRPAPSTIGHGPGQLPHRVTWPAAALPAPEPDLEPLPEDLPRPGQDAVGTTGPAITGPGQPDDTVAFVPPQYQALADTIARRDAGEDDA